MRKKQRWRLKIRLIEGLEKNQTTQQRKTKKKLKFQPKKMTKRKEAEA